MDRDGQIKLARAICEKKRTRKEYIRLKRSFALEERRKKSCYDSSGSSSRESSPANERFPGLPRTVGPQTSRHFRFAAELVRLAMTGANLRRYSVALVMMALSVYLMSSNAYEFLRNFLPLPSRQTLNARLHGLMTFNISVVQDISRIHIICDDVRTRFELGDAVIAGVLAVDAISFQRELIVTSNGVVQGSLSNETVSAKKLAKIHASFSEFEQFWLENHKALISDAFVFQFQPVNTSIKSFITHILPSTQGKATEHTVELLEQIRDELMKSNFTTIGYAMDGDTTYQKLHKMFYNEYSVRVRKDPMFGNFSGISPKLVISDPLHLLKRARYRILGSEVHLGLTNSSKMLDVNVLREILSVPSKVFANQAFTKMHDELAISMFSLRSLVELYENQSDYVAYFLPFCLMSAAISEKNLSVEERVSFLEVSLYYMLAYVEEEIATPGKLPDRKCPESKAVRLFPSNLAVEHCNTVASLLSVLYSFNGTINLNRIGTNPLEHTFGAIRMRSRYKHTYSRMLRSLGASESWKRLSSFLGVGSKITGRATYYGQSVSVSLGAATNVLPSNPRDIAVAHHMSFSLPVSTKEIECWNMNYVAGNVEQTMECFVSTLASIYRRLYPGPNNVRLNSRSILVSGGHNTCMIKKDHELINDSIDRTT